MSPQLVEAVRFLCPHIDLFVPADAACCPDPTCDGTMKTSYIDCPRCFAEIHAVEAYVLETDERLAKP